MIKQYKTWNGKYVAYFTWLSPYTFIMYDRQLFVKQPEKNKPDGGNYLSCIYLF